jgi:hypothetical protein
MTTPFPALLLAAQVGGGRIEGGWEYVWASYAIAWAALGLYAWSLWVRRRGTDSVEGRP